jgi:ABC-type transport system substrate-binding protein
MRPTSISWRLGLLVPLLLFVAGSPAQPPAKGKVPPAKGKEEEDPKAKSPGKPIHIDDEPKVPAPEPPAPLPEPGVLVVAVRELPNFISPALARTDPEKWSLDLVFEGLLRRAADMTAGQQYEPALARELPLIAPLGRTFQIAEARWTNPDETDAGAVTTEDVRKSWDQLHARAGRPGAELGEQIASVTTRGRECRVVFRRGQLDPLALATFKVLPNARTDDEAFARHPVGSGPFVYTGRVPADARQYAVFKRNPAYGQRAGHANQPLLKEVRLLASRDPEADFKRGAVHLVLSPITGDMARILNARPEDKDQPHARLEVIAAGSGLNVQTLPSRRIYYLAVNHAIPTLGGESGKLVRRVLALAIRRAAILADCYRAGYSAYHQPLNGPFPPGTWPCNPLIVKSALDDPQSAQGIRESSEYKAAIGPGKPREFELKYPAGEPAVDKACNMIKTQVEDLKPGFTIKLVAVPPDKLWRQIELDADFQLAFRHYDYADDWFNIGGLLDPSAPNSGGGRNFMSYKPSEAFGRVLADCQDRRDFGELRKQMHRLHAAFIEELPFIPLWHLDTHVLIGKSLETRPAAGQLDPLMPFAHIDEWRVK